MKSYFSWRSKNGRHHQNHRVGSVNWERKLTIILLISQKIPIPFSFLWLNNKIKEYVCSVRVVIFLKVLHNNLHDLFQKEFSVFNPGQSIFTQGIHCLQGLCYHLIKNWLGLFLLVVFSRKLILFFMLVLHCTIFSDSIPIVTSRLPNSSVSSPE